MIVGHNPGLTDLITLLVLGGVDGPRPQVCELKKGGIAALRPSADVGRPLRPRLGRRRPG